MNFSRLRRGKTSPRGKEYIIKTIAFYDSLAVHFPAGELTDQAVVAAFTLRLQMQRKRKT